MNLQKLAAELAMDPTDLLSKMASIELKHKIQFGDYNRLSKSNYNLIRAYLDIHYLVRLLRRDSTGLKNHRSDPDFPLLVNWVLDHDLSGMSIKEMQKMIPDTISVSGKQALAAALKDGGYESRVIILEETGKQGRRWFKAVSFM